MRVPSSSGILVRILLGATQIQATIDQGFAAPPVEFRPKFRYWLPDASVPADVIRQDIASVASVGAGGVEFLPFYLYGLASGGPPPTDWTKFGFGSPAFKDILKAALEESKERGLVMDIGQGANQGQGVPAAPLSPGLAVELIYGMADVGGGASFRGPIPAPVEATFYPGFMHELEQFGQPTLKALLAGVVEDVSSIPVLGHPFPQISLNESSIVDLTSHVVNNQLNWTAPAGNDTWKVIGFYEKYTNQKSCTGGVNPTDIIGNGSWIVDHFSVDGAKCITDFWDTEILDDQEIKTLISEVGKYFWEDSMEMQSAVFWTPSFMDRFKKNRGYDLTRYLPLVFDISNTWGATLPAYNETWIYGSNATLKAAVIADYRATLTEGYQEYLSHLVNWSHSLGVQYSSQPGYNIPVDMSAAIPLVDAPENESLGFPTIEDMRQFSGPALLSGKSVISNEVGAVRGTSFTQTVPDLLRLFKQSFAAGVSMEVIHGFAFSGEYTGTTWPGYNAFGFMFTEMWNSKIPSWEQIKEGLEYSARHSLVLQSGTPQVDVAAYYYPAPWASIPSFPSTVLGDLGYSFDFLGPDNLTPDLEVKNGVLAPSRSAYRALIFVNETAISDTTIKAVETYAEKGLPVFFVGGIPTACRGINACPDGQPGELLQSLMQRHPNVQAVASADNLPAALQKAGVVPRASFETAPDNWYTTWRKDSENSEDHVFVFNSGSTTATHRTTFDVDPTFAPSVLDAWTGKRIPVLEYETTDKGIVVPVELQPNQTHIYAFSKQIADGTSSVHVTSSAANLQRLSVGTDGIIEARVSGPTTLTLSDGRPITINAKDMSVQDINAWHLKLKSYVPASEESTSTAFEYIERSVQPLRPWTQIEGIETASGVGEYTSTFDFAHDPVKFGATISFGPIKDTLRAWVNDQQLPTIDVADPLADITDFVKQGNNTLRVVVTSTLFNAVKARIDSIKMVNVPAGLINPTYASAPWAEFGLVGPVLVQPVHRVYLNRTKCAGGNYTIRG